MDYGELLISLKEDVATLREKVLSNRQLILASFLIDKAILFFILDYFWG